MNKNNIIILLIIALSLSLSTCDKNDSNNTNDKPVNVDTNSNNDKQDSKPNNEKDDNKPNENNESNDNEKHANTTDIDKKYPIEEFDYKAPEAKDKLAKKPFQMQHLVQNVSQYVGPLNIENLPNFAKEGFKIADDQNGGMSYIGLTKKIYYRHREPNKDYSIRIPFFEGDSETAKRINTDIRKLFKDVKLSSYKIYKINYDALILDNILSIKITEFSDKFPTNDLSGKVIKTYLIDLQDNMKILSKTKFLEQRNINHDLLVKFLNHYISDYISADIKNGSSYDNLEEVKVKAIETFSKVYANDDINLYLSPELATYDIELNTEFDYEHDTPFAPNRKQYISFTTDTTDLKMSLMSTPPRCAGCIYKTHQDIDKTMPVINEKGEKATLVKVNEESKDKTTVYISNFANHKHFSISNNAQTKIYKNEFKEFKTEQNDTIFVKKTKQTYKDIAPLKSYFRVYQYHTTLPETIPFESVAVGNNQENIIDDLRFGSPVQYIKEYRGPESAVYLNDKREAFLLQIGTDGKFRTNFEASDGYYKKWSKIGIKVTEGKYSYDDNYIYLFPCDKDIQNGADEFYIVEYNRDQFKLLYGSKTGKFKKDITFMEEGC